MQLPYLHCARQNYPAIILETSSYVFLLRVSFQDAFRVPLRTVFFFVPHFSLLRFSVALHGSRLIKPGHCDLRTLHAAAAACRRQSLLDPPLSTYTGHVYVYSSRRTAGCCHASSSSRRGRIRLFIRRLCTDVGLDLPRDALCYHVHDTLINSCDDCDNLRYENANLSTADTD